MSAINRWSWVRTGVNITMVICLLLAGYSFAQPPSGRWLAYLLLAVGMAFDVGLHMALVLEVDVLRGRRKA